MAGDWISIWDLAQEQWPQKPRFFASRLLNYSILHDLPRRVGDVMGVIGSDVERLYNISVNSPNVDRIAKEVYLSHSLITSHIESKRFNPDDRYLPRRPRQEEYLITKVSAPVAYLPVGDQSTSASEEQRLNYFARMGIPYGVLKKKGIPIALDYRQNLIIDREAPQVKELAKKRFAEDAVELPVHLADLSHDPALKEAPCRVGSINSEEALLWNVFRSLLRENGLKYFLSAATLYPGNQEVAPDERISAAWFWGMNDRGSTFLPMTQASEQIGDSPERPTVPGLILLGINQFMLIEGRFGSTFPTCPYLKAEQCPGTTACQWWTAKAGVPTQLPSFVERQDIPRTCGRHFHLTRLYLLLKAMSANPTMGSGRLVAIIDEHQEAGSLNRKLYLDFVKNLAPEEQSRFILTSWQRLKERLPFEPRFEELHREMKEKWGL